MRIGVDLDGVVVNIMQPILARYNRKFGDSLRYDEIYTHDLWEILNISKEESMRIILELIDELDFDEVVAYEGAIEVLNELSEEHELVAITSRPVFFRERTMKWIETYLPGVFKKVIFTNQYSQDHESMKTTKSRVCELEGIDVLFEDYIDYVRECAGVCEKIFVFDQPWNKSVELPENAVRVMNWGEVVKAI